MTPERGESSGDCADAGRTQYVRQKRDTHERTMKDVKDSRQERLKLALRENLRRRKSQARGRSEEAAAPSEAADVSLDDAGGDEPAR
jgi:hypothetical protein